MPDKDSSEPVSPTSAARHARRTFRLAGTAAAVLGLPLAGLAYKLGAPAWNSLFKEKSITPFVVIPPPPLTRPSKPANAVEGGAPVGAAAGAGPVDSTKMIAPEAKTAPPPAPPRPETAALPLTPPAALPPARPPVTAPPVQPAQTEWPHLRVKSFKEQEAEPKPTMMLMNAGPGYNVWTAGAQDKQKRDNPGQTGANQPAAALTPTAPPAALKLPSPAAPPQPKRKIIPLHPIPKTPDRWPGQAAVTPRTIDGAADPVRFQTGGPTTPGVGSWVDTTKGAFNGTPDIPPKPNPPTTGGVSVTIVPGSQAPQPKPPLKSGGSHPWEGLDQAP